MATCTVSGLQDLLEKVGLDTPVPAFLGADIVHNPQDIFRAYLADMLQKLVDCDKQVAYEAIQPSNMTGNGDLVVVSPRLRQKNVAPKDLVHELAQKLERAPPFTCPIPDGIHLRFDSSPNTLPRLLLPYINDRKESYGCDASLGLAEGAGPDGPRKKVIVEFSSPNMESGFNVAHLRSTLLGAYIANMYQSMGWKVVRMNYLGDWGKQIGLLAVGWHQFGSEEEFEKDPIRHLLQVNDKIKALFKPEQDASKTAKTEHKDTAEIESHGLYAERDAIFKKMEDQEPDAVSLWKKFRDSTVAHYVKSYARLGVVFDEYSGESQVSTESITEVESVLKEKGVYEESDGSWIIDFAKHDARGLSTTVVRYRNGTTSYLLRDIAAVLDRAKSHSFDKMIYVVTMKQEMELKRVLKCLELMGRIDLASKIQHIGFAEITGLVDQFRDSRLLDDYLDGCSALMGDQFPETGAEEADTDKQIFVSKSENVLNSLGVASLFVQDFSHKRTTSYACHVEKMTVSNEESGPFIQNCYARLLSALEPQTTQLDFTTLNYTHLETDNSMDLLRIMAQYPDAVAASFKAKLEPSVIIAYIYRLVDQAMLTLDGDAEMDLAGQDEAIQARLALYDTARQVMENAMKLLGITPISI